MRIGETAHLSRRLLPVSEILPAVQYAVVNS